MSCIDIFRQHEGHVLPRGLLSNVPSGNERFGVLWYIFTRTHSEYEDLHYMWYFHHVSSRPAPVFKSGVLEGIYRMFVAYVEDYNSTVPEDLKEDISYPQLILDRENDRYVLRIECYHQSLGE